MGGTDFLLKLGGLSENVYHYDDFECQFWPRPNLFCKILEMDQILGPYDLKSHKVEIPILAKNLIAEPIQRMSWNFKKHPPFNFELLVSFMADKNIPYVFLCRL